jgi:hypothetical protein
MLWPTGQLPALVSCIAPLPFLVFIALLFGEAIYIGLPEKTHNKIPVISNFGGKLKIMGWAG